MRKDHTPTRIQDDNIQEAGCLPHQARIRRAYEQKSVQILVGALIFGNFIVLATQAEVHTIIVEGSAAAIVFAAFEVFFNVAFLIELVVNLYACFFFMFWTNPWNVFDFIVVASSLASMANTGLPGMSVLRLFRAFRVFRLFKRIESLRIIIEAVIKSLPGMLNAVFVLTLVMSMWSVLAVEFYGDDMDAEFGSFMKAMLTFLQILTLDGWCSTIVRRLMCSDGTCSEVDPWPVVFILSYVLINSVMMVNVVVAVLLDKFITAIRESPEVAEEEDEEEPEVEAAPAEPPEALMPDANNAKIQLLEFEAQAVAQLRMLSSYLQSIECRLLQDQSPGKIS
eukprot:NODE_9196_length_1440_cov_10.685453.p1 GENE.NODE_9196_length_1440_cov_10.685453~~NODE_9196_length_1440_cov_10.685453.p1  ORF type:complete len:338 (-),score=93.68 NODE_9196_length_1440_cov_10.685453:204-1217(-)